VSVELLRDEEGAAHGRASLDSPAVTDLDQEPGAARRAPSLTSPTYAVRAPLADWLRAEAEATFKRIGRYRVLDVGCGDKPYQPFFAGYASEYVGVDVVDNPHAELNGAIEALPVADGSFDLILCSQVLEHCDDPAQAVRELRRVVAPGGVVLASTHGVYVYHPTPHDRWRWTHEGLEYLFAQHADWRALSVTPASGTSACLAMLLAVYVDILLKRAHLRILGRPLIALLNRVARALDARVALLHDPLPGALFANLHVRAEA
jgi:SAM-dependent methyltransferase